MSKQKTHKINKTKKKVPQKQYEEKLFFGKYTWWNIALQIISFSLVIRMFSILTYLLGKYNSFPSKIILMFNEDNTPYYYGRKELILIGPIIGLSVYIIFSILEFAKEWHPNKELARAYYTGLMEFKTFTLIITTYIFYYHVNIMAIPMGFVFLVAFFFIASLVLRILYINSLRKDFVNKVE